MVPAAEVLLLPDYAWEPLASVCFCFFMFSECIHSSTNIRPAPTRTSSQIYGGGYTSTDLSTG